ncbi:MAG: CoA-binding protein [Bacteroidota bacterium]
MLDSSSIQNFLIQKTIAVVGVSRNNKKFGNIVYQALKEKGFTTYAVNPHLETFEGEPCYRDLKSLPEKVDAAVIVVRPSQSEAAARDAVSAGIRQIWFQQGSGSEEAIRFCRVNGVKVISGECILMFAEPVNSIHSVHRWIWRLLGKIPRPVAQSLIP